MTAFREAEQVFTGVNATSITIPVPATAVAGDLMIALINGGPETITTFPAGWTHIPGSPFVQAGPPDNNFTVMTKVHSDGGPEPADYTWVRNANFTPIGGAIVAFEDAVLDFINIAGANVGYPLGQTPLYNGNDISSLFYFTAIGITGEYYLAGASVIDPSPTFTEVVDVNNNGNGGHIQAQFGPAVGPGLQTVDINLSAAAPATAHSWTMLGLRSAMPATRGIVDVVPANTPQGPALDTPISFGVVGPVNIESLGVAIRYLRDPNYYVIYELDEFTARYAFGSSVSGMGTTRVDFTVFETGGWRGDLLDLRVFGIDADGVKFLYNVLEAP